MKQVVVERFGGPEVLEVRRAETRYPGAGEVLVRLTSVGMNHAELMGRRGEYKLSTGEPPFTPGLEGGGVIEAVGDGVDGWAAGARVVLSPQVARLGAGRGGTYRTHYVCRADEVLAAPDRLPDDLLGAVWLSHLTAWGTLVWKHGRTGGTLNGMTVGLPAASSSVALAAAQVVKEHGGTSVGLTTSSEKLEAIRDAYDHVVLTHGDDRTMKPWHREVKALTDGRGVDVFFDPVAAGEYLNTEIRALADHGMVYVYGLLGRPGPVDVSPLIRKHAGIAGYMNEQLIAAGRDEWMAACRTLLDGFAAGRYTQRVAANFPLDDVQDAHRTMEHGDHVGKMVLIP